MSEKALIPLTNIERERRVVIERLPSCRESRHRLISLGLRIGREIRVLRIGNCGPVLLAAGDSRLALGHGMAMQIMVLPVEGESVNNPLTACHPGTHNERKTGKRHYSVPEEWRKKRMLKDSRQDQTNAKSRTVKLSDYGQGQKGRIIKVQGNEESRRRMTEMGFNRGNEVQVVKSAPLTDPVEYIVKGYHVSLRREQASCIIMNQPDKEAGNYE